MSKEYEALTRTRIRYMKMTGCDYRTAEKKVAQLLNKAEREEKQNKQKK